MIICMYYTTPCIKVQRVTMAAERPGFIGFRRFRRFRGFRGCGGGSAADLKKGARLTPQVV